MATIRLTAALEALGGAKPGYDFETEDRERKIVYPYEAEEKLVWDIPDTSRNRSQIRAEFPASKFSFDLVHVEEVAQFTSAKIPTAPSAAPSSPSATAPTVTEGAGNANGDGSGNANGDGSGNLSDDGTGNEGQGKKGQGKKGQGKKS